MSYCVNCGVELGEGVKTCPLCNTPVINPNQPDCPEGTPFFPTREPVIAPVSKKGPAIVVTSMLVSLAVCCGLLNLALRPDVFWSSYIMGGAAMLWIWLVPPLLWRKMPSLLRVAVNMCAMAFYIYLIAYESGGIGWYFALALPILLTLGVIGIPVCWMFRHRSRLTAGITALLGTGLLCTAIEYFVDCYLRGAWSPVWSLVVVAAAVGLSIPLIVIRCVPSLREEARRRFHL